MGLTHIKVTVANPARPKRSIYVTFLVDSGAVYSVIPAALLRKLGVKPHSKRAFIWADGPEITRKIGDVVFRLNGGPCVTHRSFSREQLLTSTLSSTCRSRIWGVQPRG